MISIAWLLFAISGAEAAYALSSGPLSIVSNGACSPNPPGTGPKTRPDTPEAFVKNPIYANTSTRAKTPAGFVRSFANLHAVSYNRQIVTQTVNAYDPQICADLCTRMQSCASFNIYYVRNPEVNPANKCPNPPSLTNINCRFSTTITTSRDATFSMGKIANFDIVVAGSNGYNVDVKPKSSTSSSVKTSSSAKISSSVKTSSSTKSPSSSKSSSIQASTSAPKSSSRLVSSSAQKSSSALKSSSAASSSPHSSSIAKSSSVPASSSVKSTPAISSRLQTSSAPKSSSVPVSSSVQSSQVTSSSLQMSSMGSSSSSTTSALATSSAVTICPASDMSSYNDRGQETYTIYCKTDFDHGQNSFSLYLDSFDACIEACSNQNSAGNTCAGVSYWSQGPSQGYASCYGRSFVDQGSFQPNNDIDAAVLIVSSSSSSLPASTSVSSSTAETSSNLQITPIVSSSTSAVPDPTSSASSTVPDPATSSAASSDICPASDGQTYVDSDQETYTIYCKTGYNNHDDSFAITTDSFAACIGACSQLNSPGNIACTGVTYWPQGPPQGYSSCYGRSHTDQGSFFAYDQFSSAVLTNSSSSNGQPSSATLSSTSDVSSIASSTAMISSVESSVASTSSVDASSTAISSSVVSSVASSSTSSGPACTSLGVEFAFYDNSAAGQDNDPNYDAFDPATYKTITPRSDDVGITSTIFVDYNKYPLYGVSDFNQGAFVINHRGYFYAEQTGNYLFRALASDDATWIWVGDKAYSGWTKDNADVFANWAKNENYDSASTNISMVAGQSYPFRVLYAQASGNYYMWFQVDGPDGQTVVNPQTQPTPDISTGCAGTSAPPFPAFGQET